MQYLHNLWIKVAHNKAELFISVIFFFWMGENDQRSKYIDWNKFQIIKKPSKRHLQPSTCHTDFLINGNPEQALSPPHLPSLRAPGTPRPVLMCTCPFSLWWAGTWSQDLPTEPQPTTCVLDEERSTRSRTWGGQSGTQRAGQGSHGQRKTDSVAFKYLHHQILTLEKCV